MQQIERYGVIALVFLLVTIVAVSFWGDSKSPGFWSRITGRGEKKPELSMLPPANSSDVVLQPQAPLNPTVQTGAPLVPGTEIVVNGPVATPPVPNPLVAQSNPTPVPLGGGSSGTMGIDNPIATPPAKPLIADLSTGVPEYVVAKGDTGSKIAQKTLGNANRWSEIVALNSGVDSKNLKIGARLKLPANANSTAGTPSVAGGGAKLTPEKSSNPVIKPTKLAGASESPKKIEAPSSKKTPAAKTYTVHSGDTLAGIARRELGDGSRWHEIATLNPGLDGKTLSAGKQIKLPGANAESRPLVAMAEAVPARSGIEKPRVR